MNMNRRSFFARTGMSAFGAAALLSLDLEAAAVPATGVFNDLVVVPPNDPHPTRDGHFDLERIAQHVIMRLAVLMPYPVVLAEKHVIPGEPIVTGRRIGETITSFPPGPEVWRPVAHVVVTDQIGICFKAPSHRTENRLDVYDVSVDRMSNVPEIVADPIELAKLEPAIEAMRDRIVHRGLNVFTAELPQPRLGAPHGPAAEGCATMVSRTHGMAVRVIRAIQVDDLIIRFDLLGGRYPEVSDD